MLRFGAFEVSDMLFVHKLPLYPDYRCDVAVERLHTTKILH
jgi:hypothetical protein